MIRDLFAGDELAVLETIDRAFPGFNPCHSDTEGNEIEKRAMDSPKFKLSYRSVNESLISSGISLI